jgi:hypothetical protein
MLQPTVKGMLQRKLDLSSPPVNAAMDNRWGGGHLPATLAVEQEPRFRAGIIIDGHVPDALIHATPTPALIQALDTNLREDQWTLC